VSTRQTVLAVMQSAVLRSHDGDPRVALSSNLREVAMHKDSLWWRVVANDLPTLQAQRRVFTPIPFTQPRGGLLTNGNAPEPYQSGESRLWYMAQPAHLDRGDRSSASGRGSIDHHRCVRRLACGLPVCFFPGPAPAVQLEATVRPRRPLVSWGDPRRDEDGGHYRRWSGQATQGGF
jgi:hypothetical protein